MNDNINVDDMGKGILAIVVRLIGMCLLLGGLYVAFQVMLEAMELYKQPEKIQRFAVAIEKGSNIDSSLSSFRENIKTISNGNDDENAVVGEYKENPVTPAKTSGNNIRVSYFLAWVVVLMLLMLIASISLRVIKTGGELVLYDMQIKQFAKMLVKESSKAR